MDIGEIMIVIVVGITVAAGLCWVVYATAIRVARNADDRHRQRPGGR